MDLWINEVTFHDALWETPVAGMPTANTVSPARISLLWQCLAFAKASAVNFLDVPQWHIFQLPLFALTKITYATIIFCKAIFFQTDKDPIPHGAVESVPPTISFENVDSRSPFNAALMSYAEEFHRIGTALYEKFAAMAAEMIIEKCHRHAMWHFASFMRTILTAYQHRMKRRDGLYVETDQQQGRSHSRNNMTHVHNPEYVNVSNGIAVDATSAGTANPNVDTLGMSDRDMSFGIGDGIPSEWRPEMTLENILEDIMTIPTAAPW